MLAIRLIERKRDRGRIEAGEWRALIFAYAAGHVPDYQMSALLMAIYLNGLDRTETVSLMEAMLESGDSLDLSDLSIPRIDKHSTGGVGDKVSIILAPLIACFGIAVPMMSGRGLGHTGGTLDKLESIPGFRTDLSLAQARAQIDKLGCALFGQTGEIAPADRKLYALRDATATVESIPLIAASIMSKKLAEGIGSLVLDIKRGPGAFIGDRDSALELAKTMIRLGSDRGCEVVALLTAMDRPLGRACGNALEVEESIHALKGEGPGDLMDVTYALGAEMLLLGRVAETREVGHDMLKRCIESGEAAEKFQQIIEAQGGNPGVVDDPAALPQALAVELYPSPRSGVVAKVDPRTIGRGITALGGGRTTMADVIDPTVGFVISAKPGTQVQGGEPLATIFAKDRAGLETGKSVLQKAIVVQEHTDSPLPLISHRVTTDGVVEYGG